jgi:hypothetical protein
VTDRITQKEVRVEYCPTQAMIADFFTKPLQGVLFREFRDFIMNVSADTDPQNHRSVLNNTYGRTDIGQTDDGFILVTRKARKKFPKYNQKGQNKKGKSLSTKSYK